MNRNNNRASYRMTVRGLVHEQFGHLQNCQQVNATFRLGFIIVIIISFYYRMPELRKS